MAKRSQRLRLLDMAEQIDAIEAAMEGRSLSDLRANWLLRSAVERGIEIISEASRHIDPALLARHPEVPWRRVADTGNWLRHGYDKVEPSLILSIVLDHFPALRLAVSSMLAITPED
jgi:uncharacterized protein with HEPN domain